MPDINLDDPNLNEAAIKIQSGFRGHVVRKDVKARRESQVSEVRSCELAR